MSPSAVSNWEVMLTVGFSCSLMALYGFLFLRVRRYVRRKGYQSPFCTMLLAATYGAMFGVGVLYDARDAESCWSCSIADNPESFTPDLLWIHLWRFAANFSVATTMMLAATICAAWLAPARVRRGGQRRVQFPWKTAATMSLAGIPVSVALAWSGDVGWSQVVRVTLVCFAVHASCRYLAGRSLSTPLEQVRRGDSRPPVLYLRAFDREDDCFTAPRKDELAALGVPILNPSAFRQTITLEEYLAPEITSTIGAFIALGDPYDYLPPGGAARVYVDDPRWQDIFLAMARDSACIVIALGHSENLGWEVRSIKSAGFQTKLFALTSPPTDQHWYSIQWGRSVKRHWPAFATELSRAGLIAGEYPGDGATISFDASGCAVVVASGCRLPADYVAAIQVRLRAITSVSGAE